MPEFTNEHFPGHLQWTVKLPAHDGSPTVTARTSLKPNSTSLTQKDVLRELKHVCALKAIQRILPSYVRTWGDVIAYLERLRQLSREVTEARREKEGQASTEKQGPASTEDQHEREQSPTDGGHDGGGTAWGTGTASATATMPRQWIIADELATGAKSALAADGAATARLQVAASQQAEAAAAAKAADEASAAKAVEAAASAPAAVDTPAAEKAPQPPPATTASEVRCRFLRISNLPDGCTYTDLRDGLLSANFDESDLEQVQSVQMLSLEAALVELSCTRVATKFMQRLQLHHGSWRGKTLAVSYDPTQLPTTTPAPSPAQAPSPAPTAKPPKPPEVSRHVAPCQFFQRGTCRNGMACPFSHDVAPVVKRKQKEEETAVPAAEPLPRTKPVEVCEYSYAVGHADAARDIEANAGAQVLMLRNQLNDEVERKITVAVETALMAAQSRMEMAENDDVSDTAPRVQSHRMPRGVVTASGGEGRYGSAEIVLADSRREERMIRHQLALRQYIEMRRLMLGKAASKPWRLSLRRAQLLEDVVEAFGAVSARRRALLFSPTVITFRDEWGTEEEGRDDGGLTSEMFTLFWQRALSPTAGLFSGEHLLLPAPDAPTAPLEAVGLVLCKCLLDERPIGPGAAYFLYDWLVQGEEAYALHDAHDAVHALTDLDPDLSASFATLLAAPYALLDSMQLTMECFVESASGGDGNANVPVTAANIDDAVLAGCRHRLLDSRRDAMDAMRRGFLRLEDLSVQLAAFELDELTAMLKGQTQLSADELLACFTLPSSSDEAARDAGFDDVGARVADDFEDILRDGDLLDASARLRLLSWCTALTVLPFGGLRENKIKLRLYGTEVDDETLPETHTCTRELHLPNYSTPAVLYAKLLLALDHASDGFHKQ